MNIFYNIYIKLDYKLNYKRQTSFLYISATNKKYKLLHLIHYRNQISSSMQYSNMTFICIRD